MWYDDNSDELSQPVGLKLPNAFGLYDIIGNVFELCNDWYSADYYRDTTVTLDPKGSTTSTNKVVRGGSWRAPSAIRSADRLSILPSQRDIAANVLGIHCVMKIK